MVYCPTDKKPAISGLCGKNLPGKVFNPCFISFFLTVYYIPITDITSRHNNVKANATTTTTTTYISLLQTLLTHPASGSQYFIFNDSAMVNEQIVLALIAKFKVYYIFY